MRSGGSSSASTTAGRFSAYIEGRNLSDDAYIASASIIDVGDAGRCRLFEPGTGRAVYGGMKYRW